MKKAPPKRKRKSTRKKTTKSRGRLFGVVPYTSSSKARPAQARRGNKTSRVRGKTASRRQPKKTKRIIKFGAVYKKRTKKSYKKFRRNLTLASLSSIFVRYLFIAVVVLLASWIVAHAGTGNSNAGATGSAQRSQEAPSTMTVPGPAQTDKRFSTYPTWAQNFANYNSSYLNLKYWEINIGSPQNGNNEAEYYTSNPKNLRISNGALVLEATQQKEPGGLDYASARVDTAGKLSFLYGRIDVTATMPSSVGTWPAIWFLPANTKYEDMSPPSDTVRFLNGGEIDMVEEVGFNPNLEYGVVHTVLANHNNPNGDGEFSTINLPDNDKKYYLYSMLWTPTSITFEVNNTPFFTYNRQPGADYTTWPFDQPFYLIMNLALGGVWGGQDTADFPGNGIDNSALPATMRIKSIFYYPYRD